jgi:OOP family OmpA-OmpF porin
MKKIAVLVSVLILTVLATTGFAQVKAGSVHVTPTIGMYKFEGNEDMHSAINLGLRAGYNFTKYIGVEGYGHWTPTGPIGQAEWSRGSDVNVFGYGIEGIFHILPNGPFVPFVAAGVGGVHYSTTWQDTFENKRNKITADYGAGVKYFLSENIALRADVRHVLPFQDKHDNLLATVGLTFAFGGAKKMVEPAPAPVQAAPVVIDSDKDGVPDNADKCPGTPAGVAVDNDGCPLDSDKDGVYDYMDKCPGTPAGVAVDNDGCPLDSDKDGVYDYLDKCPGTPAGVKVDKDGCPPPVVQKVVPQAAAAPELIEKGRTTLNVLFDTNKADIKKNSFKEVDTLAAVLKQYPEINVVIEGHTDSVGSDAYNKKLSQSRADAVKKYMVDKAGIDAKRIKAVGFGEEKPVADNATKEGKAKNRRVEAAVDYVIKK